MWPLTQLIKKLNSNQSWRTIFAAVNNRAKDEELIVRFFALYIDGDNYFRPMNTFLNLFSDKMNKASSIELDNLELVFTSCVQLIATSIPRAFRLIRALNAAVFDSVMVGIAKRLAISPPPEPARVKAAYDGLLSNTAYRQACERATADEESVRTRRNAAIDAFANT